MSILMLAKVKLLICHRQILILVNPFLPENNLILSEESPKPELHFSHYNYLSFT